MNRIKKIALLAVLATFGGVWTAPISADDKKSAYVGNWKNTKFKLGGLIFTGYEFQDRKDNGARDPVGPGNEETGFRIGRAYLDFRGQQTAGKFKDWSFRVTSDVVPFADEGNSCGAICTGDNDYTLILKYAFITMPITVTPASLGRTYIRMGQQHLPMVDGRSGFSLQGYWGHRYIARTTWEEISFSGTSTDRGISLIHKHRYYGLHLLLANGEGYHHNNAERIRNSNIADLSEGAGDSFGLDAYGMFSVSPTGRRSRGKGDFTEISINFPFRFQNFTGIDSTETHVTTADITGTTPTFTQLIGDARAKQDLSYGVEGNLVIRRGNLTWTFGVGNAVNVDRRSNAFKIDANGFDINDPAVLVTEVALGVDGRAWANYAFTHIRMGEFGGFFRYILASSTRSTPNRRASAPSGKSWLQQAVELDAVDGTLGNLDYTTARNSIDQGLGRVRNIVFGITWHATDSAQISLGVSILKQQKVNGEEAKNNDLELIAGEGTTTSNLSSQLASNPVLKGQLGFHGAENPDLNDFVGRRDVERQVFLRGAFQF